jgi:hypothetical protein
MPLFAILFVSFSEREGKITVPSLSFAVSEGKITVPSVSQP